MYKELAADVSKKVEKDFVYRHFAISVGCLFLAFFPQMRFLFNATGGWRVGLSVILLVAALLAFIKIKQPILGPESLGSIEAILNQHLPTDPKGKRLAEEVLLSSWGRESKGEFSPKVFELLLTGFVVWMLVTAGARKDYEEVIVPTLVFFSLLVFTSAADMVVKDRKMWHRACVGLRETIKSRKVQASSK